MEGIDHAEAIGIPQEFKLITGTNGHSRKLRFLITGGCGYFGSELAKSLHKLGAHVRLLDLQLPSTLEKYLDERFTFIKGDVRDYTSVYKACLDIDCVYHVASFGMSGSDQLYEDLTEEVNVNGTKNVIKACQETGITRLIYTSSYNVVFEGKPITWGDESIPYADPSKMVDFYSKTKLKADRLIIKANETTVAGGGLLRTCCLRPAGIYGPGERRHMQRIAGYIESQIVLMRIGDAIGDWVHVRNLIQIHLLAVHGLSSSSNYIAAGKAYFASDNKPIAIFDFLRPLFSGLGHKVPRWKCPCFLMYFIGFLNELAYFMLKPLITIEPFLTRNEVMKMTIDHYHTMDAATNELGYKPKKYEYSDTVELFLQERSSCTQTRVIGNDWIWFGTKFTFILLLLSLIVQVCL